MQEKIFHNILGIALLIIIFIQPHYCFAWQDAQKLLNHTEQNDWLSEYKERYSKPLWEVQQKIDVSNFYVAEKLGHDMSVDGTPFVCSGYGGKNGDGVRSYAMSVMGFFNRKYMPVDIQYQAFWKSRHDDEFVAVLGGIYRMAPSDNLKNKKWVEFEMNEVSDEVEKWGVAVKYDSLILPFNDRKMRRHIDARLNLSEITIEEMESPNQPNATFKVNIHKNLLRNQKFIKSDVLKGWNEYQNKLQIGDNIQVISYAYNNGKFNTQAFTRYSYRIRNIVLPDAEKKLSGWVEVAPIPEEIYPDNL